MPSPISAEPYRFQKLNVSLSKAAVTGMNPIADRSVATITAL